MKEMTSLSLLGRLRSLLFTSEKTNHWKPSVSTFEFHDQGVGGHVIAGLAMLRGEQSDDDRGKQECRHQTLERGTSDRSRDEERTNRGQTTEEKCAELTLHCSGSCRVRW